MSTATETETSSLRIRLLSANEQMQLSAMLAVLDPKTILRLIAGADPHRPTSETNRIVSAASELFGMIPFKGTPSSQKAFLANLDVASYRTPLSDLGNAGRRAESAQLRELRVPNKKKSTFAAADDSSSAAAEAEMDTALDTALDSCSLSSGPSLATPLPNNRKKTSSTDDVSDDEQEKTKQEEEEEEEEEARKDAEDDEAEMVLMEESPATVAAKKLELKRQKDNEMRRQKRAAAAAVIAALE